MTRHTPRVTVPHQHVYTELVPSKQYASTRTARATHCRQCGKPRTDARPLSRRALCPPCGDANALRSATDLVNRSGPAYDQWVQATIDHARRLARST